MTNNVGINVKFSQNMSNVAPQVVSGMNNISSAAEDMKKALELGSLDERYKEFADRVDRLHEVQEAMRKAKQTEGAMPQQGGGGQGGGSQGPANLFRKFGSTAGRLGQSGDAMGAGADVLGNLGGMTKGMGAVGIILSALGGMAFAINIISQQYEKQLPSLMELTAKLDRLGGSADDMSLSFRSIMKEVSDASAEFGYSLEAGKKVLTTLAEKGGIATTGEMQNTMAYARGTGADTGALAEYLGLGRRFGQSGNILGMGLGGADASGMGPARYQEFLNATLSVFEEGLSRGVIKGFEEIGQTQAWLSGLGELFTGQTGLQMYRKMESSMVGATGLQSETDAMMFRAAKIVTDKQFKEKGAGAASYIDVMKTLESGLSADMFNEIRKIINEMSSDPASRIEMMKQAFGVSYSTASQLMGLDSEAAALKIKGAPDTRETTEIQLLEHQLNMMEDIREIGTQAFDIKEGILDGAQFLLDGLKDILGSDPTQQKISKEREQWLNSGGMEGFQESMGDINLQRAFEKGYDRNSASEFSNINRVFMNALINTKTAKSAMEFADIINSLDASQIEKLSKSDKDIWKSMGEAGRSTKSPGELFDNWLSWEDMPAILNDLKNVLKENMNIDITYETES